MANFPEKTFWELNGISVPVKIYREWRNSARVSFRKSGVIVRLPSLLSKSQQESQISHFRDWAAHQLRHNDNLASVFEQKEYLDGMQILVGSKTYHLRIEMTDLLNHHGHIQDNTIELRLASGDNPDHRKKAIRHLLSRLVARDFLPEITRRVNALNAKFFQKPVRSVSLKYNHSNWGSCSNKGNINLSTRLLFAPDAVIDYVIIHELAHLVEANHSDRFWALVEKIDPQYMEKEKWLKKNGHLCDF